MEQEKTGFPLLRGRLWITFLKMQDFFRKYHKQYYPAGNRYALEKASIHFSHALIFLEKNDFKLLTRNRDIDEFTEARIIENIKANYVEIYDERGDIKI